MKFLSILLAFGGYLLVYAATAASGRFATEPWQGLFDDAYGVSATKKQSQQPTPSPPGGQQFGAGRPSGRTRFGVGPSTSTQGQAFGEGPAKPGGQILGGGAGGVIPGLP